MKPPSQPRQPTAAETGDFYHGGAHWDVDESVGYLIRRLSHSLQRHIDARMQSCGLTHSQWAPLLLLAGGRVNTASAIARALDIDTGATTRMLDRLEQKGMLKRVWSEHDRRVAHLELTPLGRDAAATIPDSIAAVLNHHLRGFRHEDVNILKDQLRRMLANGDLLMPISDSQAMPVEHG